MFELKTIKLSETEISWSDSNNFKTNILTENKANYYNCKFLIE